ncbi:anti-sigma factor domain-containing protein [Roseateles sp. BYS78W]|uniref:Anti-sigma factor domain-containing protein n=1 Tax=Pelomonas candidula TaxID=3299025 RepID=A0ABW7HC25_9BURK
MDYSRPERAERLAAEYAVGTLRGSARRRFERLLPAHPALQDALTAWQERLQALASPVAPVEPAASVWVAVQRRLFGDPVAAPSWWQRLSLWQGLSGATAVLALAMAFMLAQPMPVRAPLVIVMKSTPQGVDVVKAGFVASVSPDGRALVLRPLDSLTLASGRALELWAVPKAGAPRSLGLVDARNTTTVLRAKLLQDTSAFAVSLEPAGGSPSGAPTGPIVSAGEV